MMLTRSTNFVTLLRVLSRLVFSSQNFFNQQFLNLLNSHWIAFSFLLLFGPSQSQSAIISTKHAPNSPGICWKEKVTNSLKGFDLKNFLSNKPFIWWMIILDSIDLLIKTCKVIILISMDLCWGGDDHIKLTISWEIHWSRSQPPHRLLFIRLSCLQLFDFPQCFPLSSPPPQHPTIFFHVSWAGVEHHVWPILSTEEGHCLGANNCPKRT